MFFSLKCVMSSRTFGLGSNKNVVCLGSCTSSASRGCDVGSTAEERKKLNVIAINYLGSMARVTLKDRYICNGMERKLENRVDSRVLRWFIHGEDGRWEIGKKGDERGECT